MSKEFQGLARSTKQRSKVRPSDAFECGRKAKRHGWVPLSPYVTPALDHFWFAGFDGKTFDVAVETQVPDESGKVLVWLRENTVAG